MAHSSVDVPPCGLDEQLCAALFSSPSQAVMVVQDLQVVLCNGAVERIVGYTAEEFRELGADSLTRACPKRSFRPGVFSVRCSVFSNSERPSRLMNRVATC